MRRRKAFRADSLDLLEERITLSHVSPLAQSPRPQAFVINTPTVSQSTPLWSHKRLPGGGYPAPLRPSVEVLPGSSDSPGVRTVVVHLQNESNSPVSSATMTERLARNISFVQGSVQTVDGGQVTASAARNGTSVIQWAMPNVNPGEEVAVSFQVHVKAR
jgi:hypothetical protein